MKKDEVPQDEGLLDGKTRDVCYAIDENGNYTQVLSVGWEPKNAALRQAWEIAQERISDAKNKVKNGEASPLLYYMEKALMDIKLLAQYAETSKRKVKKHLTPEGFNKIDEDTLKKYAYALGIAPDEFYSLD